MYMRKLTHSLLCVSLSWILQYVFSSLWGDFDFYMK